MKAWGIASAAILALIPAVALYWQGAFLGDSAPPSPVLRPATIGSAPPARPESIPAPDLAPAPAPAPQWSQATRLEAAVVEAMAGFPGEYSAVVQDLGTGNRWVKDGAARYHPASTIKMPVTLFALEQYRAGKLKWSENITYTEADFESPGGGAFETSPFGGRYPVENLVNRAIQYSNNVAVNMLGRHLGWENIRTWTRSIGGELYRLPDGTPEVTVLSELGWWLHLDRLSREEPKAAELLLTPLRNVAYGARIPAGLPKGVAYLHKFGSYNGYFHDGGIVYAREPYALVVMTHGATEEQADAAIAAASAAIYRVMTQ